MHFNILSLFRHGLYHCFRACPDALLTNVTAQSFAQLALSPCFQRRWPSLYEAFEDGHIDRTELRTLFAQHAPLPLAGHRLVLGVDASNIPRPESSTVADRTALHVHNLPECLHPITYGWQFSALVVLPGQAGSWTYTLVNLRIASQQTPTEVATSQLADIVPLLPQLAQLPHRAVLTADRYYGSAKFVLCTQRVECDKLLRIKSDRVFYGAAPPPTGKRGAPRKDGARFKCNDPCTHRAPTKEWVSQDAHGKRVEVAEWRGMHFRQARHIELTLLRVTRHGASEKKRDPKVSWFVWVGQGQLPLEQVWSTYQLRFSQEHGYRFSKQELLWEKARLCTPEQFQRWTDVVEAVRNQLVLARPFVSGNRRPWENKERAATPQQVRRAMATIIGTLGTPTHPPKPRGKSSGWPVGKARKPKESHPVIKKGRKGKKSGRASPKKAA